MSNLQKQIDDLRDAQIHLLASVIFLCRLVIEHELCTPIELQDKITALLDDAKQMVNKTIADSN